MFGWGVLLFLSKGLGTERSVCVTVHESLVLVTSFRWDNSLALIYIQFYKFLLLFLQFSLFYTLKAPLSSFRCSNSYCGKTTLFHIQVSDPYISVGKRILFFNTLFIPWRGRNVSLEVQGNAREHKQQQTLGSMQRLFGQGGTEFYCQH